MAKLLVAGGGIVSDSLGAYLRERLPDEYTVVADPIVCRREIAALVLGPRGLSVLDVAAGSSAEADCETSLRTSVEAVQAFLAEEFAGLRIPLRAFTVTGGVSNLGELWHVVDPTDPIPIELAEAIVAAPPVPDCAIADPAQRTTVAIAFRDRQITPSQRATEPFVFRSGGILGIHKTVWTIRGAVQHMERYPAAGIYHLTNHTLEQWLRAEGAPHLAELAAEAAAQCHDDRQHGLETFLVGTGLVQRPLPQVQPRDLNLGYVLSGETTQAPLTIRKVRGRGYLFGKLTTSAQHIRAEPRVYHGDRVEAEVIVETEGLLIKPDPYTGTVFVHAGPQQTPPQQIPVRFHITSAPSPVSRYIGRPLVGFLTGGMLGAMIGWLWGRSAIPEPGNLLAWTSFGPPVFWIALFAIFWAALGAVRGLLQPPAWPVRYALVRWLMALGIWVGALGLFATAAVWSWDRGILGGSLAPPATLWTAALYGAALAALPAALQEISIKPQPANARPTRPWAVMGRWLGWAGASAGLLLVLAMAPTAVRQGWQHLTNSGAMDSVQSWAEEGWTHANLEADELLEQFYLYYYDRRAPLTPKPTSAPTFSLTGPLWR